MAFVSESLEVFLKEWYNREEDAWANRQIDKWEKEKAGIDPNEDPSEILTYPEDLDVPKDLEDIKRILFRVIDYKKGDTVSPEEFKNFCIWVTRISENPMQVSAIVSAFIEKMPNIIKELETGSPDGGAFHEGFEVLADAYRPKRGMGM